MGTPRYCVPSFEVRMPSGVVAYVGLPASTANESHTTSVVDGSTRRPTFTGPNHSLISTACTPSGTLRTNSLPTSMPPRFWLS